MVAEMHWGVVKRLLVMVLVVVMWHIVLVVMMGIIALIQASLAPRVMVE